MSRHRADPCAPRHARGHRDHLAALVDLTITLVERVEALEAAADFERRRWDARTVEAEQVAA